MKYKELNLKETDICDLPTELMFEIASARAENTELIRFNMVLADPLDKKNASIVTKVLKSMKSTGKIQFFATKSSFETSGTEAVFLTNKYPELFENAFDANDTDAYFYVKL